MRIALRQEVSSPESRFLTQILTKFGEVDVLDPWDVRNVTETYDLAVGVGPVTSCPQSKRKILFVLGQTSEHKDFSWDDIIVTSKASVNNILKSFGYDSRVYLHSIPLLEMQEGCRRLMGKDDNVNITVSSPTQAILSDMIRMSLWSLPKAFGSRQEIAFSPMEFNSRCLNGAIGYYKGMDDGYDIQVRKHLALGSPVITELDEFVLGDLTKYCADYLDAIKSVEPIKDKVLESDYITAIEEIIRRN